MKEPRHHLWIGRTQFGILLSGSPIVVPYLNSTTRPALGDIVLVSNNTPRFRVPCRAVVTKAEDDLALTTTLCAAPTHDNKKERN